MHSDPIIRQMVESGNMSEHEVPFDEKTNEPPAEPNSTVSLPHSIDLNEPVEFAGEMVKTVKFIKTPRAIDVYHLSVLGDPKFGNLKPAVEAMTGLQGTLIDSLSAFDFMQCAMFALNFIYP